VHLTAVIISSSATYKVVAWLSGNELVLINVVALSQGRLILGWVTICGLVNHLRTWPAT